MERVKTTKVKSTSIVSFPPQINPVLKCQPIRKQGFSPKSPLSFFFFFFKIRSCIENVHFFGGTKGQLISKTNCQAVNSSKKCTNEFVYTTMQPVFVHFLEEIEDSKKPFEIT